MIFKGCLNRPRVLETTVIHQQKSENITDVEPKIFKQITATFSTTGMEEQKSAKKPSLVLDLDDTLVHACFHPFKLAETVLKLPITTNTKCHVVDKKLKYVPLSISVQSGVREGIKQLSAFYEISVWTAALPEYAEVVLEYLGVKRYITRVLTRESCSQSGDHLTKDLNEKGFDLENTIIVDD